jgi:hypothetical protein
VSIRIMEDKMKIRGICKGEFQCTGAPIQGKHMSCTLESR